MTIFVFFRHFKIMFFFTLNNLIKCLYNTPILLTHLLLFRMLIYWEGMRSLSSWFHFYSLIVHFKLHLQWIYQVSVTLQPLSRKLIPNWSNSQEKYQKWTYFSALQWIWWKSTYSYFEKQNLLKICYQKNLAQLVWKSSKLTRSITFRFVCDSCQTLIVK